MEKTFGFLKNRAVVNGNPVNFVATVAGDKPSCRPFGDPIMYNNKIYAMTLKHKAVSKQLIENDNACVVAYDGDVWLRVNCQLIDDSDNLEVKRAVLAEFDWAEEAGFTLDNPDFQLLYFAEADATCMDSDGQVIWQEKF